MIHIRRWPAIASAMALLIVVALSAGWEDRRPAAEAAAPRAGPADLPFRHALIDPRNVGADCKTVGDINGDRLPDVIVADNTTCPLQWYEYPSWKKHVIDNRLEFTTDIQAADIDRDGDTDIVVPDYRRAEILWYRNPRTGGGEWKAVKIGDGRGHDLELGDINRDGKIDVVAREGDTAVFLQESPTSWKKAVMPTGGRGGTALGDIDRDGDLDIAQNGYWLECPKDPAAAAWARHAIAGGWPEDVGVALADMNGDRRLDVLLAPAEEAGRLVWYEAAADPKGGPWSERVIDADVAYVHTFKVADMNQDGRLDVVTAEMEQSPKKRVSIYLNRDDARTWRQQILATTGSHNLRVADIGSDGDPDVVGANWGQDATSYSPVEMWENLLRDQRPKAASRSVRKTMSNSAPASSIQQLFPGDQWAEQPPASQGIDPDKLKAAVAYLEQNAGRDGAEELVIIRNGALIWKGPQIDKVHGVWSCTKSFTSTVLGLLIDDQKCRLDTLAEEHLPSMAKPYPKVMLRHFTTMTSGYRAVGDEPQGGYIHGPSGTPFTPADEPLFAPPGSCYAYWDSAMNQFAHALTRIAGEPLKELFRRRVAAPIGMNLRAWDWGSFGAIDGIEVNGGAGNHGNHVQISAREMARLGLLFLNRGAWNGRPLISRAWVEAATKTQVPASVPRKGADIEGPGVYGFNWWTNGVKPDGQRQWPGAPAGTFSASGYNNNDMFVIPEWRMVVVRLGLDQDSREIANTAYGTFLAKVGEAIRS